MAAKTAAKKTTKAAPKVGNQKFTGNVRNNKRRTVVSLRDKKNLSWAQIGQQIGVAPRTVRRMYDEAKGEGAHYGLLPGKGGRTRVAE